MDRRGDVSAAGGLGAPTLEQGMAPARARRPIARARLLAPPTPARAGGFVLTVWLLALVCIWVSQQTHSGLHERVDLPPLLHWVRDSALAVPMAAVALVVAELLATAGSAALGILPAGVWARLAWSAAAALVFAGVSVPGHEVHAILFGAEEEELDQVLDALLDAGVILAASLVVLVPAALVGIAPWPPAPDRAVGHAIDDPIKPTAIPGGSATSQP